MNETGKTMKKHTLVAQPEDKGLRIDQFLSQKIEQLSRNQARKALQRGGVYIGRRRIKICSYRLRGNEELTIFVQEGEPEAPSSPAASPERLEVESAESSPVQVSETIPDAAGVAPSVNPAEPQFTDKDILFIDKSIIAINKPAGVPSQPTRSSDLNTAAKMLERYLLAKGEQNNRVSLIHRLDQNASGAMLFSRTKQANISLTNQFKQHLIKKNYLVIVSGKLEAETGQIVTRITESGEDDAADGNDKPDKDAVLEFEVLERFPGYLWLKVAPKTGKTHQIRIQLSQKGVPVLGDQQYGGEELKRFLERHSHRVITMDDHRFLLHSYSITLEHPATGVSLEVSAPIPSDMKEILSILRFF